MKECQTNKEAEKEYDIMKENLRLRKELVEAQKEVFFFARDVNSSLQFYEMASKFLL